MDKNKKILIVVVLAAAFLLAYFVFLSPSSEDNTNNPAGAEPDADASGLPDDTLGGTSVLTDTLGILLAAASLLFSFWLLAAAICVLPFTKLIVEVDNS